MATTNNDALILSIVEGRGLAKGEIGLACFNLSSPVLTLYQFSDSQTYSKVLTKINALDPSEILLPNTLFGSSSNSQIVSLITRNFPDIDTIKISRKYFNDIKGLEYIKQLCILDYSKCIIEVTSKYYCLAACAALIKYIECMKNTVLMPLSIPIVFEGAERTAIIDPMTSRLLELISNKKNKKSNLCLYTVMNHTKTRGGMKLLRSNILQPSTDVDTIVCRLDTVEEFIRQENVLYGLRTLLNEFKELEYLFALLVQIQNAQHQQAKQETVKVIESKILNVLRLKNSLLLVKQFTNLMKDCSSKIILAFLKALSDDRFEIMNNHIDKVIDFKGANYSKGVLNVKMHKCFSIKPEINGKLDITKRTYGETVNDIADYARQIANNHRLPIKLAYSSARGYHLQISTKSSISKLQDLPGDFIKATKTKNYLIFTTNDLVNYNDTLNDLNYSICMLSNKILKQLLMDLRSNFGCIYKLLECVSLIDMLQSFAHLAITKNFTRPKFGDILACKESFHPIFQNMKNFQPISNNIYASKENSFVIITGPNMSGKSSYLQQVAMLQVMAQCGSFVPAQRAYFRITTQIFSRMATDDNIETANSSLFEQEMIEMKYILENYTDNSLILIDELCRSTSSQEGLALSISIIEELCRKMAFVFFATHFSELCTMDSMYSNIVNRSFTTQLKIIAGKQRVDQTHVLRKGVSSIENYGIKMTEMTSMPTEFVEDAKRLLSLQTLQSNTFKLKPVNEKRRCILKLFSLLYASARLKMSDDELLDQMNSLKTNFEEEYQKHMM